MPKVELTPVIPLGEISTGRIHEGDGLLSPDTRWPNFSERDLDFVVSVVAPGADTNGLKRLIVEDPQFRSAMIGDDRLFDRVLNDDEVLLHISPALYFEVLLRRSYREMETAAYTEEREGRASIPVFDTPDVLKFMKLPGVVEYLASMMASFTRIQSYVVPVRVRRGIRRRVKYSDMDVDSLVRFAAAASHEQRFGYYKRIADVCLFLSGVFPNSAPPQPSGNQSAGTVRAWRMRRSLEEFERDGRRFYGLAGGHPAARALELSSVFATLKDNFTSARKPLTFVSTRFLHARRRELFGISAN